MERHTQAKRTLNPMSTFEKIFSNTAVQILGKLIAAVVTIAVVKLLSTNLGVEGFGYYVTAFEFLAIFIGISDFGIFAMTVRELSACRRENRPRVLGNVIGIQGVVAVIAVLLAATLVALIPDYYDTPVIVGVWLGTSAVLLRTMCAPLTAVLQVHYQMKYTAIATIAGRVSKLFWVAMVFLILGADFNVLTPLASQPNSAQSGSLASLAIYLAILGASIGALVEIVLLFVYARRCEGLSIRFELGFWMPFLRRTLPYAMVIFLSAAYFRIDTLILSILSGPKEVGIYALAMRLIESAGFISVFFVNAALPALTSKLQHRQTQDVSDLLQKSWLFLLTLALPLVLLSVIFAVPLTLLLATSEYLSSPGTEHGAEIAIRISVWALLFSFLNRLFLFTAFAMHRIGKILAVSIVGVLFNLIANIIFIPYYGMLAAATTTVLSEMLVLALNFMIVRRAIGFTPPLASSLGIVAVAGLLFGLTATICYRTESLSSISIMLGVSAISTLAYLLILRRTVLRRYLSEMSLLDMLTGSSKP